MSIEPTLHEPWKSFLAQVDAGLSGPTELHCFGGFVVAECYGLTRATADIDIIEARGSATPEDLVTLAGKGSALARRYRVYLDFVTIVTVPENYDQRLVDVFAGEFTFLRLRAFEPHDLALAKLERNEDHDREDVKALALRPGLDVEVLRDRYDGEMRRYLGNPAREDLTLQLWIEMIQEVQSADR
jgi:hypothetical protein